MAFARPLLSLVGQARRRFSDGSRTILGHRPFQSSPFLALRSPIAIEIEGRLCLCLPRAYSTCSAARLNARRRRWPCWLRGARPRLIPACWTRCRARLIAFGRMAFGPVIAWYWCCRMDRRWRRPSWARSPRPPACRQKPTVGRYSQQRRVRAHRNSGETQRRGTWNGGTLVVVPLPMAWSAFHGRQSSPPLPVLCV